MNNHTLFYPWAPQWTVVVEALAGGIALILGLYLAARSGRLENEQTEESGREPVHKYAGLIASDSHGLTLFLKVLIVAVVAFCIVYTIVLAVGGLGY